MQYPIGITCQQLVELVTDYLENALPTEDRLHFETHLSVCPGCLEYVQQMRKAISATGGVREEWLDPAMRDTLLEVFRSWKQSSL